MAKLKNLVFMPLDLETFFGNERLTGTDQLGPAFHDGLRAYLRTQYREAILHLKAALQAPVAGGDGDEALLAHERAVIHLYTGNALTLLQEWQAAAEEYRHALELDPNLVEAHYNLGVAMAGAGALDTAIAAFRTALDHDEHLFEAHFALGRTYQRHQRAGDPLLAYVHYTAAHEIRPEAGEPLYYLGLMHQSQGAAELAQEAFARALGRDPARSSRHPAQDFHGKADLETVQWYYRLAEDLKAQGYDDEAERVYRALLQWQPSEHHAHYLLGNLLARLHRWEEAVAEYLRIPANDRSYLVARHRIATVLRLSRRLVQAYHVLYETAQIRPRDGRTFIQMGKLLYELERPFSAARALERAGELLPNDASAHYMLGFMYLVIGKEEWAITAWRRSIRLLPDNYSLRYDLACIYLRRGDYEQAQAEVTEVVRQRPDDTGAAFLLAVAYKEQGNPRRAIPLLESVVERLPAHTQALYHLGACYLQIGQAAMGRRYLLEYDRLVTGGVAPRLPHEALPRVVESEQPLPEATAH